MLTTYGRVIPVLNAKEVAGSSIDVTGIFQPKLFHRRKKVLQVLEQHECD